MMGQPFLTDLDSRAQIKGSRDPLGLVPLWSSYGRRVVGNVTTVSSSVRGFTTLLLGYYFAEQVGPGVPTLDVFLKFEQLAAYARVKVLGHGGEVRGIERVQRTLERDARRVTISADPDFQILANQRIYGLWGLYSMAARSSALLEERERVLTPEARELVESEYLPRLDAAGDRRGRRLTELLAQKRAVVELAGKHAAIVRAIAEIHGPTLSPKERDLYRKHLLRGEAKDLTEGRQPLLSDLMQALPDDRTFDLNALRELAKAARSHSSVGQTLAGYLDQIDALERVLVPADGAFQFMLTRHGQPVDEVAEEVQRAWGAKVASIDAGSVREQRESIARAFGDEQAAARLIAIAELFSTGAYLGALETLVEHNAFVMRARGGSDAWVRLDRGQIDARFRDETERLPDRATIAQPWKNTYFLNSLHEVHRTLAV